MAGEDSIDVRVADKTVWLTQKLMAELFGVDVRTVSEHLKNIYKQGELSSKATIRKFRIVQTEGRREVARNIDFYNLDAIISVGYPYRSQGLLQSDAVQRQSKSFEYRVILLGALSLLGTF